MKRNVKDCIFVWIPFGVVLGSVILVLLLRWVPVRYSTLMLKRAFQFRGMESYHTEQEWVSLEDVSPELIEAVLAAEDSRFYHHHGFDWVEIQEAWKSYRSDDAPLRGCSTITQQTAKNLFTFGTHTWARKAAEAWWTVLTETIWSKERVLEAYLNVAEFGPGIFGAEAASHIYFQKSASELSRKEAVTLAACLPSPLKDQPGNMSAKAINRMTAISKRMSEASQQ